MKSINDDIRKLEGVISDKGIELEQLRQELVKLMNIRDVIVGLFDDDDELRIKVEDKIKQRKKK